MDKRSKVKTNWNCMDFKVVKFEYLWQLPYQYGSSLTSPEFSAPEYDCKWVMYAAKKENVCSLYLRSVAKTNPEVKVQYKFTLLNTDGTTVIAKEVNVAENFKPLESKGFDNFTKWSQLTNFGSYLRIRCEIVLIIPMEPTISKFSEPEFILKEELGYLLDNGEFSDVTLVAGGHQLPAHRAILAIRSDVFAAMFKHETEESRLGLVNLTDVKPEILKEMLHFIYTGEAPNLIKMASDLLAVADKYALINLKGMCESELCHQLSSQTAVETFIIADRHTAGSLKSKAMSFIYTHATEIMNTEGWKKAITEYPVLIATELSAIIMSSSQNLEK